MFNFEITKREIIISVIITLFMLSLGFFISTKVHNNVSVNNEKYFKALKVNDDPKLFEYAINTEVGNLLSYGEIQANEPVSDPMIEGEFFSICKVKEHYVMKTREVTYTDSEGNIKTKTEIYWEWDEVNREYFKTDTFNYLGKQFEYEKFNVNNYSYNTTVKTALTVRYKFYTIPKKFRVTVFSKATSKTINYNQVYVNDTIESLIERKEKEADTSVVLFWIIWAVIIFVAVIGFVALENKFINNYY